MRKLTVLAVAMALGLTGCAFHHIDYPDPGTPSNYVDWEPDIRNWGAHYHHEYSDDVYSDDDWGR